MPLYEFRCKVCAADFEVRRPMSEAGAPATCPNGHGDTMRRLSAFASVGSGGAAPSAAAAMPAPRGCGGGCACH